MSSASGRTGAFFTQVQLLTLAVAGLGLLSMFACLRQPTFHIDGFTYIDVFGESMILELVALGHVAVMVACAVVIIVKQPRPVSTAGFVVATCAALIPPSAFGLLFLSNVSR